MDFRQVIASAGRNHHTVILKARERDGSVEAREAEPYSYRFANGREYFYCYDLRRRGIRRFLVSSIISVRETDNAFVPRWPVEV